MIKVKKYLISALFFTVMFTKINAQFFTNPILSGFYPDPSICRAGNDYYIVVSSFAYYPGLPIFHSTDLVNWKQIGAALNRPEQLNLDGAGVSRGLFAPSITFHKGTFYIICTLIDKGGTFIITTTDPQKNNWSNPTWLPEINGIDPSIFFDDNDKSYIVYNSEPPENKALHDGHRTIRINEFDVANLKVTSSNKIIVNGGTNMAKKPVWIEAPHLLKKDGWYYLICAEGGTGYNHSEVVFRTKTIEGPFIPYENNPILTQRQLDRSRKNPITTAGHADFVQTPEGKWWAVFLACRPYEAGFFNTGRETFMAPVEWKNEWPIINPNFEEIQYSYPINAKQNSKAERFRGNYFFRDDFTGNTLNNRYNFLRTVREKWYNLTDGKLILNLQPETCSDNKNPSFIGFRQPHLKGYAATSLNFSPVSENEKAGLLVFQSEQNYYFLCKSVVEGKQVVQLFKGKGTKGTDKIPELLLSENVLLKKDKNILFKIEAKGNTYSFYYATEKNKWKLLKENVDATFLSTATAGGFVGCFYSMYATSNGTKSNFKVSYDWFECKSEDDIFKEGIF